MSRQLVYDAIISYIEQHQYPPSIREICNITGIKSTSMVHNHIDRLMCDGLLETDCGFASARAIRVPGYRFVKEMATNEDGISM